MSSKKSRGGVTKSQTFAAGCVASAVAETTTHPLDFVKTHLQLQRTNGGQQQLGVVGKAGLQAAPRPQGFRQMFSKVMREDGVSGFYKGLNLILSFFFFKVISWWWWGGRICLGRITFA